MWTSVPPDLSLHLSPRAGTERTQEHAPSLTCHHSHPACLSAVSDDFSLTLLFSASLNSSRKGDILSMESGTAKSKVPLPTPSAQGRDHPPGTGARAWRPRAAVVLTDVADLQNRVCPGTLRRRMQKRPGGQPQPSRLRVPCRLRGPGRLARAQASTAQAAQELHAQWATVQPAGPPHHAAALQTP